MTSPQCWKPLFEFIRRSRTGNKPHIVPLAHRGRDAGIAPDAGSETAQQPTSPTKQDPRRGTKEQERYGGPYNTTEFVSQRVRAGALLFADLDLEHQSSGGRSFDVVRPVPEQKFVPTLQDSCLLVLLRNRTKVYGRS